MRVAATGDFHYFSPSGAPQIEKLAKGFLASKPDLVLLAGDLTSSGRVREFDEALRHLDRIEARKYAVLGNHDLWTIDGKEPHTAHLRGIYHVADKHGVRVLDGSFGELNDERGQDWAIIGCTGWYDYSFAPKPDPKLIWWNDWSYLPKPLRARSEGEMTAIEVKKLSDSLEMTRGYSHRLVVLHCAPSKATVQTRNPLLRRTLGFMGSTRLGDALASGGPIDAVFHGHAHFGKKVGHLRGIRIHNSCVQLNAWEPVVLDL
jgi:predicted phosphohydrolase